MPASRRPHPPLLFAGCALLAIAVLIFLLPEGRDAPPGGPPEPGVPPAGRAAEGTPALAPMERADRPLATETPSPGEVRGPPATWRVAGTVARDDGTPVGGAEVALALERGAQREALASLVTGADGRYASDLPAVAALPPVPRATARLVGRATAPGHRPGPEAEASLPISEAPRSIRLDLVLVEGATLRGRVVDAEHRPVAAAWVAMDGASQGGARTDGEGRYALGIAATGSHLLKASVAGVGTGRITDVRLDAARDAEAPDLVLRGAGTLAGQAVFPDGLTAPDVRVYAFFADGDPDADGIGFGTTTTDAAGRFAFAGLRPGRWVLGTWGRPKDPQAAGTWVTGEEAARVVVDRHALLIRVVDAGGHPVPGAGYVLQGHDDRREFSEAGTVERADGVVALGAAPGTHVRFTATVGDDLTASVEATLEEGRAVTRVDAVLGGQAPATGRLRVLVEAPGGTRVPTFTASLRREGERMRMVDQSWLVPEDDEGLLPPVPPGRFVVEVRPGLTGLNAPPVALWFRVEASAEVRAGAETVLRVAARPGGRLRLTVRLPEGRPAPSDLRAQATLLGGEARLLHSFVTFGEDAWTVSSALTPGMSNVAGPLLEAGRYTVRVTAAGFRPAEVVADVVAGEVTDVEAWLAPE